MPRGYRGAYGEQRFEPDFSVAARDGELLSMGFISGNGEYRRLGCFEYCNNLAGTSSCTRGRSALPAGALSVRVKQQANPSRSKVSRAAERTRELRAQFERATGRAEDDRGSTDGVNPAVARSMTRQHDHVPTASHADRDAHGDQRPTDQPAVAMVRERLARGQVEPAEIAAIIDMHPAAAPDILAFLHQMIGNQAAMEVSRLVGKSSSSPASKAGSPEAFEQLQEEIWAADEAAHSTASKAGSPEAFEQLQQEIWAADEAAHDGTRAPKSHGTWVTRARQYNRKHADDAAAFLSMTGSACVDEATGEADPKKVARWQADHGLPPDGRIGPQTVTAATIEA
ncbi:MAG: peptidoglycan-binding protein [Myxococcales bacterium]|nr:peptidoglycan-binding protein [Myxococcales bacterium]